jgi:hypothetical protein
MSEGEGVYINTYMKTIPITIIIFVLVNIVSTVWWMSKLDSRVVNVEDWIEDNYRITSELKLSHQKFEQLCKQLEEDIDDLRG